MDFELSEDQKLLIDTVQSFVKKDSPVERMRRLREDETGWDKKVWKQMGELGWLGVMFPESAGGAGMSFVEAGLILEQLGTTLVPEPYVPLLVAGGALSLSGSEAQLEQFLAPAIAGDASLALATTEAQSRHSVTDVETKAEKNGSGFRLSGKKRFVDNGHAAQHILVSARTAGGPRDESGVSLFVVDPGMKGVKVESVKTMDGRRAAMLELDGVEVGADRLVGDADAAAGVLEHVFDYGAAAACAEGSGIMQTVLWMTRNYLTERKQFGVAIGTFQALQHRNVDMFVETELGKGTMLLALLQADATADERKRAVSAAKLHLCQGGGFVTRQGIQLHGGIGVTDEHDVGLYFKRMQVLYTAFGDDVFHVRRFASLPSFAAGV
ncbi:MAG: acyl-CoA dehydrogenase family protein [Myxococcales bacterium]|nr:acyl-CoA dehydrogenase family protein [Myxococcales bacterium]